MKKKQPVYVLGIHDGHNASAALIADGAVLAAITEERLTNIKNYSGVPVHAIKKVCEISGITPADISLVTVASLLRLDDPVKEQQNILHILAEHIAPLMHQKWFITLSIAFLHMFRKKGLLKNTLQELGIEKIPLRFIEHHTAHAASAYYQRPWDGKTLILTMDGMGDGLSATVSTGNKFTMNRIAATSFYDSVGNNLYSEITAYLGMKRWEHEYKIMGLAPYGKAGTLSSELKKLIRINPQHPLEFENTSGHYLKKMQEVYTTLLAGKRFDTIAAAAQEVFEDLVIAWVKNAVKETGIHRVVCAGGSFLNVKCNKRIRELAEVDDVFFYPAADDGGASVGAALEGYYRYCEEKRIKAQKVPIADMYYGQRFSDSDITAFLKSKRLLQKVKKVTAKDIAKKLADGKIIARFCGRDEWGPRALGNRSILADPRNLSIIRKINFAIKQRDFWMPFGPAILQEDMNRYLKHARFAPYMIEAFDTKPQAQKDIPATLHPYDLTARPQIVNNWNTGLQRIIKEFKNITGVGAVLNTSFNLHGYPVCGSLEAAYDTFTNSALDGLLLEDWLLERP